MGLTHYLKKIPLASRTNRMLRTLRRKVSQQPLLRMLRKVHPWENLPAASLQEPYQLLHYQPGDEERWMEVLTASGEFGGWTRSRLAAELLSSLLPGGGIFLAHNGQLVG